MSDRDWRLFVAVPLDARIQGALAEFSAALRTQAPGWRWVSRETLHVTLRFLGETPPANASEVESAMRAVAGQHRAGTLSLKDWGCFPSRHRARVLWVGLGGEVDTLVELARDVEVAVTALGFEPEARPFSPHVTIARAPRGANARVPDAVSSMPEAVSFSFNGFALMRSHLDPKGARYETIAHFGLADRA